MSSMKKVQYSHFIFFFANLQDADTNGGIVSGLQAGFVSVANWGQAEVGAIFIPKTK